MNYYTAFAQFDKKANMKIIIAFDSFKDCITAEEATVCAAEALQQVHPEAEIVMLPLSDGGEGLVECVSRMKRVDTVCIKAHGPLMEELNAAYALSLDGTTAYMEMAATSGLQLVAPHKRNPLLTTTYGVGDMILDATRRGCKTIIMGIGGSATCDGGKGMIQCLADNGYSLPSDSLPRIIVACDVNNPLYGENGAAYIFAPQKGATPEQVVTLDKMLRQFAQDTEQKGIATPTLALTPGAGAAGGLGYGLLAYLHAELQSGIDTLLTIANFGSLIQDADLIITGEGKSDRQTLMGKVAEGVRRWAAKHSIPVHLLSGCIEDKELLLAAGFATVNSINEGDPRPLHILMQPDVAKENIKRHLLK